MLLDGGKIAKRLRQSGESRKLGSAGWCWAKVAFRRMGIQDATEANIAEVEVQERSDAVHDAEEAEGA